jgi:hypothetical protein
LVDLFFLQITHARTRTEENVVSLGSSDGKKKEEEANAHATGSIEKAAEGAGAVSGHAGCQEIAVGSGTR